MAQDKVAEIIKFTGAGAPPVALPEDAPAPQETDHAGAFLAAARAAAGLSIETVSDAIKVKAAHLEAIEAMRADLLPALPYATGFIKTYARYLGLDAEAVAARFRAETVGTAETTAPRAASHEAPSSGEGARLASVFAILAIILFAMWVGFQVLSGGGDAPAQQPKITVNTQPAPQPFIKPALMIEPGAPAETDQPTEENASMDAVEDQPQIGAEPSARQTQAPPADSVSTNELAPDEAAAAPSREEAAVEPRPLPRRARPAPQPTPEPVIEHAELIRSSAPDYPERCAPSAGDLEAVTVNFDISQAGRATNMRISSSTNSCFVDEALKAVARWRFTPSSVNGEAAVETGKSATLNFRK